MPRLSDSGKWIFSAGEVAEFVVCPESWRLRRGKKRSSNLHGELLHDEWAERLERSNTLFLAVRVTTTLAILVLLIFLGLKIGN
jgi:hypothetical protein